MLTSQLIFLRKSEEKDQISVMILNGTPLFLTPTQLVYMFVYNRMNKLTNNIYDCEKKIHGICISK